jgi:hypothetical protein
MLPPIPNDISFQTITLYEINNTRQALIMIMELIKNLIKIFTGESGLVLVKS